MHAWRRGGGGGEGWTGDGGRGIVYPIVIKLLTPYTLYTFIACTGN